jgi:hypothetical protein
MYFWLVILIFSSCPAAAQTPYYQGKTIRIMVGYPAGSAHDMWGRLVAPQLTKHIPGNPATVVENRTGAGSMVAANYIYNVAKPDGLTIGVINAALYFDQLMKRPEAQFDWSKYSWVGSSTPTNALMYMWAMPPIRPFTTSAAPPCLKMWCHRHRQYRLLLSETPGTSNRNKISTRDGVSKVPILKSPERGEVQCRFFVQVFLGGTLQNLAQQESRPRPGSNG